MEDFTNQHVKLLNRLDAAVEVGKDQLQQQIATASCSSLPVTYLPFKFENRRLRIDWRLLHGVDITKLIRDTDLDTLERLVSCITWGDIEAEDTRHLSEASFVKIFRLAQLLLEYLLYVQDNLKYTNSVLEQSRGTALIQVQAATARCNEVQLQLKLCKKELRSVRKTVKTLELMAAAVKAGTLSATAAAASTAAAGAAPNVNVTMRATLPGQNQEAAAMQQTGAQQQQQQQQTGLLSMTTSDVLLQGQLAELTERMAVAGCELERLREEREELQYQVRYLYDMLAAKTGGDKSSQKHFSPIRSAMLANRASGSPYSWRRQYGDTYEAAATAEVEEAAANAAAAAAAEEVARRTAVLEQQHAEQVEQLKAQAEQQVQSHKAESEQSQQVLQQSQKEVRQCQQQMQQWKEQVQQLEMQLDRSNTQVEQLRDENTQLRERLSETAAAPKTGDADGLIASLKEQLQDKMRECTYLQGELNQRDNSIATFKQANDLLERELEELQKQKVSPDATTPSFVAKQRKSIAMAETKAEKAQQQITELMQENMALAQQVTDLRSRLAGGAASGHEDAVAAAEQLLSGQDSIASARHSVTATAAAEKAWQQVADLKQEKLALSEQVDELKAKLAAYVASSPLEQQEKGAEWKLQEIERLQNDNRLLQQKVTSLQQQCADLERLNAQLERQAVKARNLGLAASLEASATNSPASGLAAAVAAGGGPASGAASWARGSVASAASVASSGPREELTAADLAAGGMVLPPGLAGNEASLTAAQGQGDTLPRQQQRKGDDAASESDDEEEPTATRSIAVRPAAQQKQGSSVVFRSSAAAVKVDGSWIKKPAAIDEGLSGADAVASVKIAAYRPPQQQQQQQQQQGYAPEPVAQHAAAVKAVIPPQAAVLPASASAASGVSSSTTAAAGGQISKEAAAQLKGIIAQISAAPQDQAVGEYREMCDDWDLPFDLKPEEKEWFQQLMPFEVPGQVGLLSATQHSVDEFAANQGRLLAEINKQLDGQLASYGIHPGRTGLSNLEFLAAMRMLSERRAAWESQLSPEEKQQVDAARCGVMLHPYNVSQALLQQQPDGPDGKKHLPGIARPALSSAVRPPAAMLPAGPAPIRTSTATGQTRAASQIGPGLAASASPAVSSRYQQGSEDDSDSETGSPHPYYHNMAAPGRAGSSQGPLGSNLSPVKAGSAAAALHVASRAASYSTTTYRADTGSGLSSPELSQQLSQAAAAGPAGFSPMSAALQKKPSPRGPAPLQPAAAVIGPPSNLAATSNAQPASSAPSRLAAGGTAAVPATVTPAAVFMPTAAADSAGVGPVVPPQQHSKAVSPGIAAAMKQYMGNSFGDSDEF